MGGSKKNNSRSRNKVDLKSVPIETKILVDEATGYLKSGIPEKALELYTKALELSPHDKNALIARSRCHLLLGEPQKALNDAEAALRGRAKGPHNARALFAKAEALYHLGDFELSLVFYYRGMKIRPEFDQFRLGVQKAKEAIQNILGVTSVPISKKSSSSNDSRSQTQDETLNEGSSARPKTCSPATVLGSEKSTETKSTFKLGDAHNNTVTSVKTPSTLSVKRRRTRTVRRTGGQEMHLLRQLNVDKKYLQNLVKRPDIKAAHQESAQHIIVHAEEGINFLKSRQEFWSQQQVNKKA